MTTSFAFHFRSRGEHTPRAASPRAPGLAAGEAFDRLAEDYDDCFTDSLIGRAQRNIVWRVLAETFHAKDNLLELNCGTGEDAFFMADRGLSIFACDASQKMIQRAEQRMRLKASSLPIVFCHLPTERIAELTPVARFDGAYSNFSGLNCVQDLSAVATSLAGLIKVGDSLVFCVSTRFCLMETLYFLYRADLRKAFRRWRGHAEAMLDGATLTVYYPTLRSVRRSLSPYFRLRSSKGVGVAIPPSYLEAWARRHSLAFRICCRLEQRIAALPILRTTGDHMVLRFERVA